MELANIYRLSLKLKDIAWKLDACGDRLVFGVSEEGKRRLLAANFCQERLCPLCMHRRTVRVYTQMSHVLDWLDKLCDAGGQPHYRYLLLTLTIKNCAGSDLMETMDHLMHSWSKLRRLKPFMRSVKGYFRVLEVTRNDKEDTYHPHFHVMLCVNRSYFHGDYYIPHGAWVRMWREAAQLDYDPQVDVRAVKETDGKRGGVAEVTKYTVKGSDYIYPDLEKAVPVVETLREALFGRRLYFFGGYFADARKALKLGDAERDLTDIEEVGLRRECIQAIERFDFVHGNHDWVKTSEDGAPPADPREYWLQGRRWKDVKPFSDNSAAEPGRIDQGAGHECDKKDLEGN